MPAIATATVHPEMTTARPDVAAAISTASSGVRPFARVEQRVVDPDGHADEQDHARGRVGDRQ
jgi:hypothetical protein